MAETVFTRERVGAMSVLVVGAGALGNEVVKALGLLGVGRVVVVDPDLVETGNLARSVLLRRAGAVGRNKAEVMAEAVGEWFPDTEVVGIGREIGDVGFETVAEADLVFGCVDSELARVEMAYIATKLEAPVCDGGLGAPDYWRGRVSWFPGREGACFSCLLSAQKRRELLTEWDSPARSCWRAEQEPVRPSTPTMAAMVGSLQVEMGFRKLSEAEKTAWSWEIRMEPEPRLETIRLQRGAGCPFHLGEAHLVEAAEGTIRELLEAAAGLGSGEPVLLLDWPICVQAECEECHKRWHPMRRVGWLRRRGRCPGCGSSRVRDQETVTRVDRTSVFADLRMEELGLPENHLHSIRFENDERA